MVTEVLMMFHLKWTTLLATGLKNLAEVFDKGDGVEESGKCDGVTKAVLSSHFSTSPFISTAGSAFPGG